MAEEELAEQKHILQEKTKEENAKYDVIKQQHLANTKAELDMEDKFKEAEHNIRLNAELYHRKQEEVRRQIDNNNHQTALLRN